MAEEVELKLALAEAHQSRFLRHPLLKQAVGRHAEALDNIYYDTADLSLRRRGIALRLRRKGRDWLQTVKLAGSSSAGLSTRPEWETPYTGRFDFSSVDQSSVREWLQRPKLLARIIPVCETRFRRITWQFSAAPGAVLLTLDRGWIIANGRREPISELELELSGAPVQAIFDLAGQLAERVSLTPAVWSKAERGYRLHTGAALAPTRPNVIALSAAMSSLDAFRVIALSCLEHLQQNHRGAVTSDDPEYIRQMRVATRRLRAALRIFAPALPERLAESLRAPLKTLTRQLDLTRNLDVLRTAIVNPALQAMPDEPRLAALAEAINHRRDSARSQAIATLAAPGHGRTLLLALAALHAMEIEATAAIPLAGFAAERLKRLRNRVRRSAAAASVDNPRSLRRLRIGIKRLRHALELFAPLATKNTWRRAAERLAPMQDVLGQVHDLTRAGAQLMSCAGDDPRLREAVTLLGGWHGPRHAKLLADIKPELARMARLRLRPRLPKPDGCVRPDSTLSSPSGD